jgi:hypothetical protein
MSKRLTILFALLGIIIASGCSENNEPFNPSYKRDGKISVFNQSGVRIRLLDITQIRGEEEASAMLNRTLNSGFRYYFKNILDGGDSEIFKGGDMVIIHFRADVPNPDDPSRPLFENTISHTINGVTEYYVKTGGRYSIQP